MYTLDYLLCYKEAFALGVATGLIIAILLTKITYSSKSY
jgi:hypothetical protein